MIHSYRYINKHRQFEATNCTLIIEARENDVLINTYRIEKSFKVNENLIDDEFLRVYAYNEIDRIVANHEIFEEAIISQENTPEETVILPDLPLIGDEQGVI